MAGSSQVTYTLRLSITQRIGQFYDATQNRSYTELNIRFPNRHQANCMERNVRGRTYPKTNILFFDGRTARLDVLDPCKVVIVLPLNLVREIEPDARGLNLIFDTSQNADICLRCLPLCTKTYNPQNPSVPSNRLFISYNWTFQQLAQALPGMVQSPGPIWPSKTIAYH